MLLKFDIYIIFGSKSFGNNIASSMLYGLIMLWLALYNDY